MDEPAAQNTKPRSWSWCSYWRPHQ